MPDDQKVLEILLKTRAELAGAKQLEESLERQIGAAKALGDVDGLKKLQPQLEAVRGSIKAATDGNTDLAAAEKESSEAAEFLHHNHRQLHMMMHLVGGEAGHAGAALLNMFRGPVGPILALVGLFELVKGKIDETEAEAEKLSDELAKPMGAGIEAYRKSLDEAKTELGKFLSSLKHAGDDNDPIKTEIERAKQLLTVELENQKKIIEGLHKVELQRLRASGASPEQIAAVEARQQSEIDHLNEKVELTKGSSALMLEQTEREQAAARLATEAQEKRGRANQAKWKFEEDQTAIQILSGMLGLGESGGKNSTYVLEEKKLQELTAERDTRKKQFDGAVASGNGSVSGIAGRELERLNREIEEIIGTRDSRRTRLNQLQNSETSRSQATADAETDATDAEGKQKTNTGRLKQIPGDLDQVVKVEDIEQHTNRITETLNQHGGKLNESLGQLMSETGKTHDQQIKILTGIVTGLLKVQNVVAQLETQLAQAKENNWNH